MVNIAIEIINLKESDKIISGNISSNTIGNKESDKAAGK